uniref:Uncharacterized protein LOC111110383 isoform X1 n=1 Tax=Crassostrea virginica TaxID=6565 RepID=A0A8B8BHY6_CRAVI|nr:uncharacterized protein LOC111110383 isoform X1 [Crassostrea virginica]
MASEELLTLLLGLLSAIIIGIITCYFLRRHHGRKSDVQCTCVCNNNCSMGQGRSLYFIGATGLLSRSKELPISIQSLLCSTTYRSVLELEIIEEKDPVTGLCVNRFNSKTER